MKVIFIKDLRGQGKISEIKEVSDGYAQNFLIKNGYAIPVNDHNLNELKNKNKKQTEVTGNDRQSYWKQSGGNYGRNH